MADKVFASVTVIEKDCLFLAVSRKKDHQDLGFPGGRLEQDETPEAAAIRELEEETGLRVSEQALSFAYSGPDDTGKLCSAFSVSHYEGEPRSLEGAWVGWVRPERLLCTSCSFRLYNHKVFARLGLEVVPDLEVSGSYIE